MSWRKHNHRWYSHMSKLKKQLNTEQRLLGVKNKPRHRQLTKARREELLHEFKSNY